MPRSFVLFLVLLVGGCTRQRALDSPNFLFIVIDDQRFDMLGVVSPFLHTPNMDALAGRGVRFENAFVTTPICAASRASLLTGLVERSHRYTFGTPPLSRQFTDRSYPRLLRQAGYHTGFIGKFGVNTEPAAVDSMFNAFVPLRPAPYLKTLKDGSTRHLTDITADESINYLRSDRGEGPFALTVSFNAPHADDGDERQFIWSAAMDSLYTNLSIEPPALSDAAFFDSLPEFQREASLNRIRWYWRFDTPEKAERMTRGHFRMISGVDAAIGRILDELDSLGLADNTIVVLMGDNGYFLGERGYAGKWTPHELSIRVPLIVYDPLAPRRGTIPTQPVLNIDIAPTLLELAGVEVPGAMQGRSLVPLLAGASPADWREDFFVEHLFNHPDIPKHEGVRGARFKYARYFEQVPVYEELYDLLIDPLEAQNLAGDPDYGAVLRRLEARTDELRDQYGGRYAARERAP